MSNPPGNWLAQCDRCLNNTHNPHLRCAVHLLGVAEGVEQCPDFEADPQASPGEWWEPEGASLYAGEVVISPVQRWTRAQKLELMLWHPVFTGLCPQCRCEYALDAERVHWDCPACGWVDDAV